MASVQRYFIEISYKGTRFGGFQLQPNTATIQGLLEKAMQTYYRRPFSLTGSSRTDAGVHALQNYFHCDSDLELRPKDAYHLNALLPKDVVVQSIRPMHAEAHCRFDAIYRRYQYTIISRPDPFQVETAWMYPYPLDLAVLHETAAILLQHSDFTSFSKRNTQSKTMICTLTESAWQIGDTCLTYTVQGNRFLRGMVRALVGTMLQAARGKISIEQFVGIILARDCTLADFSTPPHGLRLEEVGFSPGYFGES